MVLVVNQRQLTYEGETYEGVRTNQEPQAQHSVEAYYDSVMGMNPSWVDVRFHLSKDIKDRVL